MSTCATYEWFIHNSFNPVYSKFGALKIRTLEKEHAQARWEKSTPSGPSYLGKRLFERLDCRRIGILKA